MTLIVDISAVIAAPALPAKIKPDNKLVFIKNLKNSADILEEAKEFLKQFHQ